MDWSGNQVEIGRGVVKPHDTGWRLELPATSGRRYSDAQLDDTDGRRRSRYLWRPPLILNLQARFSHPAGELKGTAGFGFWNVPFGPGSAILPALPRAAWFFFGSPPHNIPLALGVPGNGWKAACLDAGRPSALLWAPLAPLAVLAMQSKAVYRWLWPRIQRALGVWEAVVPVDMTDWHQYTLYWRENRLDFVVDGETILQTGNSPRGPMGFVVWIDNQYAVVTPRGHFGWGKLAIDQTQWLEIKRLQIESGRS